MTEYITVYTTVENEDVAVHVATALVKERLVACANITSDMRSIYEWDGIIQYDSEVVVVCKTKTHLVDKIIARIKEMHSYDIPCITVSPITAGNPEYLEWISRQVLEA
ncbi:divalent-cation tolerance protein CutA [Kordiimonas pumila]|uniref:Divalent-cation tolerance protein CutA n=1 Tax=Kordiimonas pumila TaxID=2161677 RepID=A0ABV7D1K2_9PROT|nr:divalent-cation tolerance protein CutA [Kordiimonas pumila]